MSTKETLFRASRFKRPAMKNEYPSISILEFAEKFNLEIRLTPAQQASLERGANIIIPETQLDQVVQQIARYDDIEKTLATFSSSLLPVSVSLYVLNDRLWDMMKRKTWDPNKMLAMCTVPLCTWDQKHESTSNPKGIKRWPIRPNSLEFQFDSVPKMTFHGEGGDFSGFIEQSQLTMRKWGIPDTRRLIPNYVFQKLHIETLLERATILLNPIPRDDFDYDFSEHARIFFEHGFLIQLPGEDVTLQVGRGKPSRMAGNVFLLIGSKLEGENSKKIVFIADIWFKLLEMRLAR